MIGVIGTVILLIIGVLSGSIAYLIGWSEGWDDSKKFIYTALDEIDDERIVYIVRRMADKLRGGEHDES